MPKTKTKTESFSPGSQGPADASRRTSRPLAYVRRWFFPRNRFSGQRETYEQSRRLPGLSLKRERVRRPQARRKPRRRSRRRSRPGARLLACTAEARAQARAQPRGSRVFLSPPDTSRAAPSPRLCRAPQPRPSRAHAHRPRAAGRRAPARSSGPAHHVPTPTPLRAQTSAVRRWAGLAIAGPRNPPRPPRRREGGPEGADDRQWRRGTVTEAEARSLRCCCCCCAFHCPRTPGLEAVDGVAARVFARCRLGCWGEGCSRGFSVPDWSA